MDTKNKIYVGVIIIAFALTGYFLYSSFFGGSGSGDSPAPLPAANTGVITPLTTSENPTGLAATPQVQTGGIVNILPLGNKFDTTLLKRLNTQFNIFNYPKVTTDAVGITTSNLIKSANDTTVK